MPGMASKGTNGRMQDAFLPSLVNETRGTLFSQDEQSIMKFQPGDKTMFMFNVSGFKRLAAAQESGEIGREGFFPLPPQPGTQEAEQSQSGARARTSPGTKSSANRGPSGGGRAEVLSTLADEQLNIGGKTLLGG